MTSVSRQCVILAGGLGTRLGPLTASLPKPMLPVGGRPFLEHLVRSVHRYGFNSFVFLAGYRADVIASYFRQDGPLARELGAQFETLIETSPMGTAGALRSAGHSLKECFLMMNGDSFFDFNLLDLATRPTSAAALARLALRKVSDTTRYGTIERMGDRITGFQPRSKVSGGGFINGGVYWLNAKLVDELSDGPLSLEDDVFPRLAEEGRLSGAPYEGYFIDIGVPEDYREADTKLVMALRRPAVFFDRDKVLNEDSGYTSDPRQLRWIAGAHEAIKLCNDAGYFVFVVTNQAGVARGYYDESAILSFHASMNDELRAHGAHVDAFRYCPHHPKGVVQNYAIECTCRKPKPGMVLGLLEDWPVITGESLLIGDKLSDLEAGVAAGIRSHQFKGGNLAQFVRSILPGRTQG